MENKKYRKKETGRVKISDIMKPKIKVTDFKPVDMAPFYEEDKKKVEADKIRYEKELKEEDERYNNLACPVCKSKDKKKNVISHNNEPIVYGGRNSVNILAEYCICQSCGSMYVDLNKNKVTYPYQGFFSNNLHHY